MAAADERLVQDLLGDAEASGDYAERYLVNMVGCWSDNAKLLPSAVEACRRWSLARVRAAS